MSANRTSDFWILLTAEGEGRWDDPSTAYADGVATPKQYYSLYGAPSLLQLAVRRALRLVPQERIAVAVRDAHRRWWEPELCGLRCVRVIAQPSDRGTGLGVLLSLLVISTSDPEAGVICWPAIHHVEQEAVLAESVRQATAPEALNGDRLTLLGMTPDAPDFAWTRGGGLSNSGIFAGRIPRIVNLYPQAVRGLLPLLRAVVESWPDTRRPSAQLASLYARHPMVDFARDVLQRHPERLQWLTVPPCGWRQVNTPAQLGTILSVSNSETSRIASAAWPDTIAPPTEFAGTAVANEARFSLEAWQE